MYKKPILLICFILALVLTNTAEAVDPDLVGWWRLDEGSGTTAVDSSGQDNHGTIIGNPPWVNGNIGLALDFDGITQYVNVPHSASLGLTKNFTIAAWIRPDVVSDQYGIVTKCEGTSHKQYVFTIWDGELRLEYELSGNNYNLTGGTMTAGNWQHVAVTIDSSLLVTLYINAASTASETAPGEALAQSNPVAIGRWSGTYNNRYFDGLIDDARIYNRALTVVEIGDVMSGKGIHEASNPAPPHLAVDVPVDANLEWGRGDGALWDYVYFGTDPCDMDLPQVDTLQVGVDDPLYDPGELIASTTYYWYITEVNSPNEYPGPLWSFSTIPGEASALDPADGAEIDGEDYPDDPPYTHIWTMLIFDPGPTAVKHTGYFSDDYSKVYSRHQDVNLGSPPYPFPGWEYIYFAGNPEVGTATDTLVRGKTYY
ncbi:MAG: LamG domain-containing protein, partial [Planctomycetota bacterium]